MSIWTRISEALSALAQCALALSGCPAEADDELDQQVLRDEPAWTPPDCGVVGEDAAMEAKMAAIEAALDGPSAVRVC